MVQKISAASAFILFLTILPLVIAQADDSGQTMRPVIRGRHAAVASMKAEATEAARRILDAAGSAFDPAVGAQAALAVTDFSLHRTRHDPVLLVFNAPGHKVSSVNPES